MRIIKQALIVLFAIAVATPFAATAQNVSGVPGPVVRGDEKSAQFRVGIDPDNGDIVQRLHYQQALDDDTIARLQLQYRTDIGEEPEADFVQFQIWRQLTPDRTPENRQNWQSALRLDLRLEADGPPGRVALNWLNQFRLADGLDARFFVQGAVQIGDGANDGILLQTRASLRKRAEFGTFGLEQFSNYGSTSDFGAFADQSHLVGPFVSVPVGDGWSAFGNALFGLTRGSDDVNIQLRQGRQF